MKIKITFLFLFLSFSLFAQNTKKPNILWLVCEDISPTLSFYGDTTAKTPNLDALAKESLIFDNAFATTGVCAPSRSAIITGMLPSSIGTMHMRTGKDIQSWGKLVYSDTVQDNLGNTVKDLKGIQIRQYSAVIPDNIKCFTEYLRANGYYCTNNQKTDYQFAAPQSAWDENDNKATWEHTPDGMPFFSVFNFGVTHESKIWGNKNLPLTVDPKTVPVPSYYPDDEIVRADIARHYSNIELLDKEIGEMIAKLKKDGLYDNTIIFFYSDHGGPLPRQKREIFDSGLKTPLIIRFPNAENKGRTDQMVSFTDLAPTVLSLAEVNPPKYMEGKAFLGKYKSDERKVIYGTSDRFDEFTDRIRAVRSKDFLYVKNYYVDLPKYKNISYRFQIPMMMDILEKKKQNLLNDSQNYWFQPKTSEELYDCKNDPYQLNNLAYNPKYNKQLIDLRAFVKKQFEDKLDFGTMAESEMVNKMWPNGIQPKTENVIISNKNNCIKLTCPTKGASICFCINSDKKPKWQLYTNQKIAIKSKDIIKAKAIRIGYHESEVSELTIN